MPNTSGEILDIGVFTEVFHSRNETNVVWSFLF